MDARLMHARSYACPAFVCITTIAAYHFSGQSFAAAVLGAIISAGVAIAVDLCLIVIIESLR